MSNSWPMVKLGYLVQEAGGSTPSKANAAFWDGDVPWVSPKDMKVELIGDSQDHVSAEAVSRSSLRLIPPGSVLLVVRGMILAHTVPVAETTAPVTLNQDMKALLPSSRVVPRFLRYSLKASQRHLLSLVEVAGHGTCCLRSERWRKHQIVLPPPSTQRAIADFLDRKTAAIDALIEKKERLLALLAEKRAALIHQAVTKGLDPNVPMKDSGVPWIGQIPAHWEVKRMRFACVLQRGFDLPTQARRDGDVPIVAGGGISGWHDVAAIEPPCVVTGRYGTVGEVHLIDQPCWPLNTSLYVKEFWGNDPDYIRHLLSAAPMDMYSGKSAVPGVDRNDLHAIPVAMPQVTEQRRLVAEVRRRLARSTGVEAAVRAQIDRLREYRQALITAAVTGQLDLTAGEPPPLSADPAQPSLFEGAL